MNYLKIIFVPKVLCLFYFIFFEQEGTTRGTRRVKPEASFNFRAILAPAASTELFIIFRSCLTARPRYRFYQLKPKRFLFKSVLDRREEETKVVGAHGSAKYFSPNTRLSGCGTCQSLFKIKLNLFVFEQEMRFRKARI